MKDFFNILKIEIFKVLSNKKFILFTLILPLSLYLLISLASKSYNDLTIYSICSLYGILGNTIITTAARISREKEYYEDVYATTKFSSIKNCFIQIMCNLFLSTIIITSIFIIGVLFFKMRFNMKFLKVFISLLLISVPSTLLGFDMGRFLSSNIVPILTNFIYFIMTILGFPNEIFSYFPKMFIDIHKNSPFYFMWEFINTNESINLYIYIFSLFVICILLLLVNMIFAKIKNKGVENIL